MEMGDLSMAKYSFSPALNRLKNSLPEHRKPEMIANIRRNWFFPFSAMGLFCLNARINLGFFLGIPIAFLAALLVISQIPSLLEWEKKCHAGLRILSFLTAAGICWGEKVAFCRGWLLSPKTLEMKERIPMLLDIINVLSILAAVIGVCFAYFCVLAFWKKFLKVLSESKIFSGIGAAEWVIYGILALAAIGWMVFAFAQTKAFYETELTDSIICGAIYTSDSPLLVQDNSYLTLTNPENDIRQPLFAVFAAPFIGLPYLIGRLINASTTVEAILMNGVQVLMLFAAHLMLSRMMKLDMRKRVCFMLLVSCTYPQMLFSLMMEQYIVSYFWLAFCMYLMAEKRDSCVFALYGAGGTLLTSMALVPFSSKGSPLRSFKMWFLDMLRFCFGFVALMLFFCRFDVIFNLVSKLSLYSALSGHELTFLEKLYQYTAFLHDCLLCPDAGIKVASATHISWQLNEAAGINLTGIALLALAVFSAVWNWDKMSSRFAALWIGLSTLVLLIMGWGTTENGLVLYALYFGWALWLLLFQLAEKIESKLNVRFLLPALSVCGVVALAAANVPSMIEMVKFAIQYYPT